jgi:hypothetical protein
MENKKLLIGAGVVIVGYLLWKKSQTKVNTKQYSKECLDGLERALQLEYVKPPDFEKTFLENCKKSENEIQRDSLGMPRVKSNTIEKERAMSIAYYKTLPDSFTIDNVNYTKNSNLEFYKTPFIPNSFSGVQPIKISGADFNNAHIKFRDKDLPKFPTGLVSYPDPVLIFKK